MFSCCCKSRSMDSARTVQTAGGSGSAHTVRTVRSAGVGGGSQLDRLRQAVQGIEAQAGRPVEKVRALNQSLQTFIATNTAMKSDAGFAKVLAKLTGVSVRHHTFGMLVTQDDPITDAFRSRLTPLQRVLVCMMRDRLEESGEIQIDPTAFKITLEQDPGFFAAYVAQASHDMSILAEDGILNARKILKSPYVERPPKQPDGRIEDPLSGLMITEIQYHKNRVTYFKLIETEIKTQLETARTVQRIVDDATGVASTTHLNLALARQVKMQHIARVQTANARYRAAAQTRAIHYQAAQDIRSASSAEHAAAARADRVEESIDPLYQYLENQLVASPLSA